MRDVEVARAEITLICPTCFKRTRTIQTTHDGCQNPIHMTCSHCGEWLKVELETDTVEKP
jgi:hypothetical protein